MPRFDLVTLNFYETLSHGQENYRKSGVRIPAPDVKRIAVFYGEFENEKKKEQKKFDLPERGFEPQIFCNFPAHDLKTGNKMLV